MRPMGSPLLVAPGRPADVDPVPIDKPASQPFPTVAVRGPAGPTSKYWSKDFHYPEFRHKSEPRPERQLPVHVDAVLTLRNQRGEVVDIQLVPVEFRPEVGTTIDPLIPVEQYTIDLLAVMLADQTAPGKWTLTWQEGGSLDEGLIISALHRTGHDKIPGGCAPCDEKSRTITPKEPIVVTVPVDQATSLDRGQVEHVLKEVREEIASTVKMLSDEITSMATSNFNARGVLDEMIQDALSRIQGVDHRLSALNNEVSHLISEVEGRLAALEARVEQHTTDQAIHVHP